MGSAAKKSSNTPAKVLLFGLFLSTCEYFSYLFMGSGLEVLIQTKLDKITDFGSIYSQARNKIARNSMISRAPSKTYLESLLILRYERFYLLPRHDLIDRIEINGIIVITPTKLR